MLDDNNVISVKAARNEGKIHDNDDTCMTPSGHPDFVALNLKTRVTDETTSLISVEAARPSMLE